MKDEAKKMNGDIEDAQILSDRTPIEIVRVLAESQCARLQTVIKWLCLVIVLLIACNIAQFVVNEIKWSSFNKVIADVELSTEDGGNANYIGNDGDINNYGKNKSEDSLLDS